MILYRLLPTKFKIKLRFVCIVSLLLALPLVGWGVWREEGRGTIVLEKGDSMWKVARSLYGKGSSYPLLWQKRLDSISNDPNLVYPGMRFYLYQSSNSVNESNQGYHSIDKVVAVGQEIATTIHHIALDIDTIKTLDREKSKDAIPNELPSIISDTISSLITELIIAIIVGLSTKYGFQRFLRRKGWSQ